MSDVKKYWYIQLNVNFFDDERIDWLSEQKNGNDYIVLYLKLCLKTANNNGILTREIGEMIIPYDVKKVSEITNIPFDTILVGLDLFKKIGLIYEYEDGFLKLPDVDKMVGYTTQWAIDKAKQREKLPNGEVNKKQQDYRAKKKCEEVQHVPFIEDYVNTKRYSGNYYIVFNRDKMKCRHCGSIEALCVHHIDGYDENKKENNDVNKMITLCRECHGIAHSVNYELLNKTYQNIGYYDVFDVQSDVCEDVLQEKEKEKELIVNNNNKEKNKKTRIDYSTFQETYNSICVNLPECYKLSDDRKKKIAKFAKSFSLEDFETICHNANNSNWHIGNNDRNWKANFDWLLSETNANKMLELNPPKKTNTENFIEQFEDI